MFHVLKSPAYFKSLYAYLRLSIYFLILRHFEYDSDIRLIFNANIYIRI